MNNSYIDDIDDWTSIIGYYFFLKEVIATGYSKCQQTLFTSILEIEYMAMSYRVREGV